MLTLNRIAVVPWRKATCESMNTYPICDSPPSRSARRCFISLEKLGRNHRSCVWIEALPAMVFVSVQKLFSIVKKVVIDAIVTSNLYYCNSLLYSIPKYQQDRLQRILNAAVRIVCLVYPSSMTSHQSFVIFIGYQCPTGFSIKYFYSFTEFAFVWPLST